MIPRKDSDYHKLKQAHEKLCYLNGMPKQYITGKDREPEFMNFKANSRVVSAAQQKKVYDELREAAVWGPSHSAFWLSSPHDKMALEAACQVLRKKALSIGFRSFEFISPFEDLRWTKPSDDSDIRELYVLLGANERDVELTHRIRRWMRQPHGASIWVVGTAQDPYRWACEDLGCIPTYMFWIKRSGISVG